MLDFEPLLAHTIPEHMLKRGFVVLRAKLKPIDVLFEQRRIPDVGWDDDVIDLFLTILSMMDTDKDPKSARIGEREGRVASPLVSMLGHGFCHGVGRSGNLLAPQTKAAGASLAQFFANRLALDAMKMVGAPNLRAACVIPMATGMAMGLAASVAREEMDKNEIVYPRIDIHSPLKGIQLVGMKARVVEGEVFGDAVKVPVERVSEAINDKTAAIVSTTSFFPPREPDDVKGIAKLAKEEGVFHIVNNAYGAQSHDIMKLIKGAIDAGRVDFVIQSTDKNFLTPVGGSIVSSPDPSMVEKAAKAYAGRASAAPIIQFLASILSLGVRGYDALRDEQERNRRLLEENMTGLAQKSGERLLNVFNPIAVAITLKGYDAEKVGHYLYSLRVTGPRVVKERDYGVCCREYHSPYVTVNAAIGSRAEDIHLATRKLEKALEQSRK